MLNAAGLAFVVAGSRWGQPDGQVMFLFILAMAAAEVSVGLALVLQLYHRFKTLDADAGQQDARLTCSHLLWLIPLLPFAGFAAAGAARRAAARGAVAPSSASARSACRRSSPSLVGVRFRHLAARRATPTSQTLWTWIERRRTSRRSIAFYLDALSLVMIARRHRRRLPDPPLLRRVHGATTRATAASSPT